jgi:hypothetical protein
MATPHVSGAVALLKQKNPSWSPEEIKASLKGTTVDIGDEPIPTQGWGRINLLESIFLENPLEIFNFGIFPIERNLFGISELIELKGAFPEDYDSLSVEYKSKSSEEWSNEGVKLIGTFGVFASFDSSILSHSGDYLFNVTIKKNGISKSDFFDISFSRGLKSDWNKNLAIKGHHSILTRPIVFDFEGDGLQEIGMVVVTDLRGPEKSRVYFFDSNGSVLHGWPKDFESHEVFLAFSDFTGDGIKEVVISEYDGNTLGVYDKKGNILPGWPVFFDSLLSRPSVADLDNDGQKEIIVAMRSPSENLPSKLFVYDSKGSLLKSFNMDEYDLFTGRTSPVLGDLNGDGFKEIGFSTLNFESGGSLYFWDYMNESFFEGWPKHFSHDGYSSSPILGDVDGDGLLEIYLAGNLYNIMGLTIPRPGLCLLLSLEYPLP